MQSFLPFVGLLLLILLVTLVLRDLRQRQLTPPPAMQKLLKSLNEARYETRDGGWVKASHRGHEVRVFLLEKTLALPAVLYLQTPVSCDGELVIRVPSELAGKYRKYEALFAVLAGDERFDARFVVRASLPDRVSAFLALEPNRRRLNSLADSGFVFMELKKRLLTLKKLRPRQEELEPVRLSASLENLVAFSEALEQVERT